LASTDDGISGEAHALGHENGDVNGTRLARFCSVAKGRALTLTIASADEDLTAVSPDGGCHGDWAEEILEHELALVVG